MVNSPCKAQKMFIFSYWYSFKCILYAHYLKMLKTMLKTDFRCNFGLMNIENKDYKTSSCNFMGKKVLFFNQQKMKYHQNNFINKNTDVQNI